MSVLETPPRDIMMLRLERFYSPIADWIQRVLYFQEGLFFMCFDNEDENALKFHSFAWHFITLFATLNQKSLGAFIKNW